MNPIESILQNQDVLILDGAFSTELERRGCDLNDPLWSAKLLVENPDEIAAVHTDYFQSGADCVITASYQATYEGFMKKGLSEKEAEHLIKLSVRLAQNARDHFWLNYSDKTNRPRPLVAASIGPYGAYLADGSEYLGKYDLDEAALMKFHQKRLQTIVDAKPDILACETIPCLIEAKAIVHLLEQIPEMFCWISFSAKDGEQISNGEQIEDCAQWLDDYPQVAAIGINCTAPKYIESLIKRIKKKTDKPVIVYPNSGEIYDPSEKRWQKRTTDLSYAERSKLWFESGAQLIGGCCRTTPEDIQKIAAWVRPEDKY